MPPTSTPYEILDERRVCFGGRAGTAYTVLRPHDYAADPDLDRALSTFRALVFVPEGHEPADVPVVTLLQGITAPLERSGALIGPLLDAGLGLVVFDTPFGGTRRSGEGPRGSELDDLGRVEAPPLTVGFAARLFDGVAGDFEAALAVAAQRHGLAQGFAPDGRLALFGVSFGCLLSSYAFGRDGRGQRLLGACGHPDLPAMSRGLSNSVAQWAGVPQAVTAGVAFAPLIEGAARRYGGDRAVGALRLASLLVRLGRGGRGVDTLDPLRFAEDVPASRPVRLLTGDADTVATPEETRAAAARYADGDARVVAGLGHGWRVRGPGTFDQDCVGLILDSLADWTERARASAR